jgi:hypothetical protein
VLPSIAYLTAAKDRIRWLSRRLAEATTPAAPKDEEAKPAAFAVRDHSDGKFWMVDLDERHASRQAELNDDTLVPLYDRPATPAGGGDLPELPPAAVVGWEDTVARCVFFASHSAEDMAHYYTAEQMREYGELCRLASTGSASAPSAEARDAARYRWLRNDPPSSFCVRIDREGCHAIYTDGEILDATIDAAMSADATQETQG